MGRVAAGCLLAAAILMVAVSAFANEVLVGSGAHEARALIRSAQRIEYRSEIVAPVARTPVLVGQAFRQGDELLSFDCTRYEAELKAAKAAVHASSIEHRTKRRLLKYQAAGKDEVALAAAGLARAAAEVDVLAARNRGCVFSAPFDGRVSELNARPHEFAPADRALITVINDRDLEIELVVPSDWMTWLETGSRFTLSVDETAASADGRVERIGAEVDPVSQTVKLIGRLDETPASVLAGMSGTARFHTSASSASN